MRGFAPRTRPPPETVLLVNYIRTAQQLGFSLAEIGLKLPDLWQSSDPGPTIAQAFRDKVAEIDARIEALRALRDQLAASAALGCPFVDGRASA